MSNAILFLTLFFMMFPWLSFGLNTFDMQPWLCFLYPMLILLNRKFYAFKEFTPIYIILLATMLISIYESNQYSIRAFFTYFLFVLGIQCSFYIFNERPRLLLKLIVFSDLAWIFFGLIQLFLGIDSLSFLVNLRSSDDRGVTSLSPEPTHFGFHMVFYSWLLILLNYIGCIKFNKMLILLLLNMLTIVFLAKSSMATLCFVLMVSCFMLSKLTLRQLTPFAFLLFLSFIIVFELINQDPESRISQILSGILSDPLLLVQSDGSVNARVAHWILPIYGAFCDYFSPHGFSVFIDQSSELNDELGSYFWYGYETNIIMSGLGAMLYELGILGLLVLVYIYRFILGVWPLNKFVFFNFITLIFMMSLAMPVSYPLFGLSIIALYAANRYYHLSEPSTYKHKQL